MVGALDAVDPPGEVTVSTRGRVVTCFSPKGGVGKTTVAVNLALSAAREDHEVCLVDLDLAFGDVAITLQLFPARSFEDVVRRDVDDADGPDDLLDLLTPHESVPGGHPALSVLAAPDGPEVRERVTPTVISRVLESLAERFELVVVDTASAFDELTLAALDATDDCVLVTTLDVPTLKNVKLAVETLDALDLGGRRHLVLNRADEEVGLEPDLVEAVLGMPIVSHLPACPEVARGTNTGRPVVAAAPDHATSAAFAALAGRVLEPTG